MNTSEITIGILLGYSKTFDTIGHLTLLEKLQKLKFSIQGLKLTHSYISKQKHFVQVDDKSLSFKLNFGMSPVLLKLYIIDLAENFTCNSLQYAGDSTLYKRSKLKNLKKCIQELESDLETVSLWSSKNSLIFNDDKTKLMLFSTIQLNQRHNLNNNELFKVMHNGEAIKKVNTKKIFGIHFDENLS